MPAPIALTCGDPSGVGPELAVKAWDQLRGSCPFVWIGDPDHLPDGAPWEELQPLTNALTVARDALPVLRHPFPAAAIPGRPVPENAAATVAVIERAVGLVRDGQASAICTAPINKKVLIDGAGFAHPGHTEYLAALAGRDHVVMMLASDRLRVVPTTIHIPLCEVPAALTPELLTRTIRITIAGLRDQFAIAAPRLAVAGLNPHAGEGGAMGSAEIDWIADLLADLNRDLRGSATVTGPHPADTLFHDRARAGYDAAICMYHDQALIPIKTLDFDRGVNVTLGLPFIRTSPDHGTAYDIAGTGAADPGSLIEALKMARHMAGRRGNDA